jgi:molecular chaperone Hsp33
LSSPEQPDRPESETKASIVEAKGRLHRGLIADRAVRFLAVELGSLAELTRVRHGLGAEAGRIAAEGLVSAALMSAYIKGTERITLQIQGERPRLSFACDVDAEGGLRAQLSPPQLAPTENGALRGLLLAIKADAKREIYRGITRLEDETLEVALRSHLAGSDQVEVFLRIGTLQTEAGEVVFAGGLLLERLPEDPNLPSISLEAFRARFSAIETPPVEEILTSLAFGQILDEAVELLENRSLVWRCSCSQERIEAVLRDLPANELIEMLEEDRGAEVTCHFCNIAYRVDESRLAGLITEKAGANLTEA